MNRNDDNKPTGQNDPSEAMNTKRDVQASPDAKTDQDFPGYPHYPAKEGMMGQESGQHRVDANLEEAVAGSNKSGVSQRFSSGQHDDAGNDGSPRAEGETDGLAAVDSTASEIGTPQNVSNEDIESGDQPGSTDRS